jgi:integrase
VRRRNAARWPDNDLVFTTQLGTLSTRPTFGVRSAKWLSKLGSEQGNGHRESCGTVSSRLLSSAGIPIEGIAALVGHANTRTTEKVYRKELRRVPRRGAKAMDDILQAHQKANEPQSAPASAENDAER